MKLVVIESPFRGTTREMAQYTAYLQAAMHDCLTRGEAPYASHGLYTQDGVLDDTIPEERELGIQAGFAWRQVAELTAVYDNFGFSDGMRYGIRDSDKRGVVVEYRTLLGFGQHVHPDQLARGFEPAAPCVFGASPLCTICKHLGDFG